MTEFETLAEGAEQTLLLGFSMGGALAVVTATRLQPDEVVLLAPFWRFDDWRVSLLPIFKHVVREVKPFGNADFSDPRIRETFKEIVPDADLTDPNVQARLKKTVTLPTEAIDQLRRLGRKAYRLAPRADVPCLVVQGKNDSTTLPNDTRRLVGRLRRGRLVEIVGGHTFIGAGQRGHKELLNVLRDELSV